jgi:hypothetical protein
MTTDALYCLRSNAAMAGGRRLSDGVKRRHKKPCKLSKRNMENLLTYMAMARGEKKRNLDVEYKVAAVLASIKPPNPNGRRRHKPRTQ